MDYFLYRLNFKTAVHIGKSNGGASLDDGQMILHSDTIFSALCCEAAKDNRISKLYDCFADGTLTISDALPYAGNEIFLPKPVIYTGSSGKEYDPNLRKALKGVDYIPLLRFENYIKGLKDQKVHAEGLDFAFGQMFVYTRVCRRDNANPLPYHAAAWSFKPGCGLYIILKSENEAAKRLFAELLINLGISGVGGKQSSGWGKFEVNERQVPDELVRLLEDSRAGYQMLLGTGLPEDNELEAVIDKGWYKILRRGGFIRSRNYSDMQLKKHTIYMLGAGSCLPKRFRGGMIDLSDNGMHPIWRCANTLFAGVNL